MYIILFLHQTTTFLQRGCKEVMLYIILFLHQTTTVTTCLHTMGALYIILFLHQTTTGRSARIRSPMLYIILFLHQTTTSVLRYDDKAGCISSFSYIKPQLIVVCYLMIHVVYHPFPTSNHNTDDPNVSPSKVVYHPFPTSNHNSVPRQIDLPKVVYHPFPTSNHNLTASLRRSFLLYIILFLHQTTTHTGCITLVRVLYIILFLHQTTTLRHRVEIRKRCISSFSYIKPQPWNGKYDNAAVVYHPFPTSNHNCRCLP